MSHTWKQMVCYKEKLASTCESLEEQGWTIFQAVHDIDDKAIIVYRKLKTDNVLGITQEDDSCQMWTGNYRHFPPVLENPTATIN